MSPPETCKAGQYLEHPAEALAYYRKEGVDRVICERKHMGSRAVIVVCRDEAAAAERFGIAGGRGAIYTRTGRPCFADVVQPQPLRLRRYSFEPADAVRPKPCQQTG